MFVLFLHPGNHGSNSIFTAPLFQADLLDWEVNRSSRFPDSLRCRAGGDPGVELWSRCIRPLLIYERSCTENEMSWIEIVVISDTWYKCMFLKECWYCCYFWLAMIFDDVCGVVWTTSRASAQFHLPHCILLWWNTVADSWVSIASMAAAWGKLSARWGQWTTG